MEDNYQKAYKEILEILKYVPEESVKKIPQEMRDMFEKEQLKTYDFQIDTSKTFEEQELLEETKAILANIFRDYWATPYQKERIEIKEKYDPENVFKRRNIEQEKAKKTKEALAVVEYKESIFKKFLSKIKALFRR